MYRNLLAMETEELLRSYPVDGAVLMGGCDKTTPALLMGAASAGLPAIFVPAGPMLRGNYRGQPLGSGTDMWKYWDDKRAGLIGDCELAELECGLARSPGHCMTMGTASTMACMVESLGLSLPGNAAIPAPDSRRGILAHLTGRRIVEMVHEDLRISKILTREAFQNAIRANAAIGGSTNAVIHLIAFAGRVGVPLSLDDWDRYGREVKTILDIQPSGRFLMEEFYYAGGLPAILWKLAQHGQLDQGALTVNGKTIGENVKDAPNWDSEVIRDYDKPLVESGGIAVLRGNLCPDGAVLKPSAASPHLMKHRGQAVVFETIEHYYERIGDPDLAIDENSVMVLKNCGPRGYPGMAEVGNMGLPAKVLAKGITDMVRISDARMSGTAYGTVVLHICPEAALGGPLALVREGDWIELDVPARRLHLEVDDAELARRRAEWTAPEPTFKSGYQALFVKHVMQADKGADFDFLVGCRGHAVPRESH
jgi:L-arabonate dehydrase